jgi:hypothetical protein
VLSLQPRDWTGPVPGVARPEQRLNDLYLCSGLDSTSISRAIVSTPSARQVMLTQRHAHPPASRVSWLRCTLAGAATSRANATMPPHQPAIKLPSAATLSMAAAAADVPAREGIHCGDCRPAAPHA